MTTTIQTELSQIAAQFVNSTSRHIFLTGKAGTGKTTFLRSLGDATHKKFIIVAPTGIAALNAKGVTIHSQFLLPHGTFLPDTNPSGDFSEDLNIYTQNTLARKHPLSAIRRQVLRDIDLLIIDEVSMLRADLLDAIDYRLKAARRNFKQAFGGVQLLMIGDLYQLPPIVKDHEWNFLRRYYRTAHFFEAKALQASGFVYIELDKIFRQSDDQFIRILNNLRNNTVTKEDIEELNQHYVSPENLSDTKGAVTITTHNYKADEINQVELNKIKSESFEFSAHIEGDFPEYLVPVSSNLELKVGAQVMFIKNDSSAGAYFNGKLARVVSLDVEEGIEVEMDGFDRYTLKKEKWENKKYTINSTSRELDEEIIGEFEQYPIKLAWAITVHKSQGLTFDKAIIDVGQAFAPGQVYVALSRLRSLDGLILRTRIDPSVIATDNEVVSFTKRNADQESLALQLRQNQEIFLREILENTFNFQSIVFDIERLIKNENSGPELGDQELKPALKIVVDELKNEFKNTDTFRRQLLHLLFEKKVEEVQERTLKGSTYYSGLIKKLIRDLLIHLEEMRRLSRTKGYVNELSEVDLVLTKKLDELDKVNYLVDGILAQKELGKRKTSEDKRILERASMIDEIRKMVGTKEPSARAANGRLRKTKEKKEKKTKLVIGATYEETYALIKEGLSPEEIAQKRGLSLGTIESHAVKGISEGKIEIEKLMDDNDIATIRKAMENVESSGQGALYNSLDGKYTFGQLRMVIAHQRLQE